MIRDDDKHHKYGKNKKHMCGLDIDGTTLAVSDDDVTCPGCLEAMRGRPADKEPERVYHHAPAGFADNNGCTKCGATKNTPPEQAGWDPTKDHWVTTEWKDVNCLKCLTNRRVSDT